MAEKTVIGVIPLYDEKLNSIWMLPGYLDGIYEAGAVPVILPMRLTEDEVLKIDSFCDGYLFTGGHDVNPELYWENNRGKCGYVYNKRDSLEKTIFGVAYEKDKPILGICRGIQIINVLAGGTLYQDIPTERPSEISHSMEPPYDREAHKVEIVTSSSLYTLLKEKIISVNSYHHQAIRELAPSLSVMAKAEDGIIEAVEDKSKHFLWAVQWHPEFLYKNDANSIKIFKEFVNACKRG